MNRKKSKQHYLALKLDIEKSYDRIEWNFLRLALKKFNFHPRFISLILVCVTSSKHIVKVNGISSEQWEPARGLRQGDPLSPYLFILCQDLFISKLLEEVENKNIDALKTCQTGSKIPIFCFADDYTFL